MSSAYQHMTNDEFLELLDNYGNNHAAIHEAANRIRENLVAREVLEQVKKYLEEETFVTEQQGQRAKELWQKVCEVLK